MKHYICTGDCEGVSDKPGICQAEVCQKHGMPLTTCECEGGMHSGPSVHVVNEYKEKKSMEDGIR